MSARLDAINALEQAIARLTDPAPIGALDRAVLVAQLAHAKGRVSSIEELQRKRRVKKETA